MRKKLLASWAHPSLLAAVLLPTLVIVGASRSTQASVVVPGPAVVRFDVAGTDRNSTANPNRRSGANDGLPPAIEMPFGAEQYIQDLPFGVLIESIGERYGVDPLLIAAVAEAESNFRVDAVSPKGALGLMQLMPVHVEGLDVEPFDPQANLELGAALLANLSERFDGELELALAAYHAGPGAVDRFGGVPPYRSTERYIERVLEIYLAHYSHIVGGA